MKNQKNLIIKIQKTELTEYLIYLKLSKRIKQENNKKILEQLAEDELRHYNFWQKISKQKVTPYKYRIFIYNLISFIFGLTFTIKLLEKQEETAQNLYKQIKTNNKDEDAFIQKLIIEEQEHEKILTNLIIEDRFKYIGSMVLGLNDALVELTGALAGLTLALQNSKIIAVVGLITGISASMSMSASEYLSIKVEKNGKNPITGATYTGIAYILTVIILIMPFLILDNVFMSLGLSVFLGIGIIAFFTFYTATAQNMNFKKRFFEMSGLSLGVALISFFVGFCVKTFFDIDV